MGLSICFESPDNCEKVREQGGFCICDTGTENQEVEPTFLHQVYQCSYSSWVRRWKAVFDEQPDNIEWDGVGSANFDPDIMWKCRELDSVRALLQLEHIDDIDLNLKDIAKAIPYCKEKGYDLLAC